MGRLIRWKESFHNVHIYRHYDVHFKYLTNSFIKNKIKIHIEKEKEMKKETPNTSTLTPATV